MTMNRIADREYDRRNPRTADRALPAGKLSPGFAWLFTLVASAVLFFAASRLNRLSLELAPAALAILFFYSYTKRFTSWSHFVLGFCLGISPLAAWIAVRGSLDARMLILCAAVTLWVGGFDVLYACQDVEFDRTAGLHSIPKKVWYCPRAHHRPGDARFYGGAARAAGVTVSPCVAGMGGNRRGGWSLGVRAFIGKTNDLSKMNAAFFAVNGYISLLFLLFWARLPLWGDPKSF